MGEIKAVIVLVTVLVVVFSLLIYFTPTIVVLQNKHHANKAGVIIVNLLFGWSFIGWVVALVWAFQKTVAPQINVSVSNQQGHFSPQPCQDISHQPHIQSQFQSYQLPLPEPVAWQAHLYRNGSLLHQFSIPFRPMVVGRGQETDVRIDDGQVSRRQWQVMATSNGVELKDLGSSNGTWKHGQVRVDSDLAGDGDWYQVGPVQIVFSRGGS